MILWRLTFLFLIYPSTIYADQGLKISCINMISLLDTKPKVLKFEFDIISFKYLDEEKNIFVEVPNKNLKIGNDFFAIKFLDFELGFQVYEFEGKKPIMTMSKYDYKNKKFSDHYLCDSQFAHLD